MRRFHFHIHNDIEVQDEEGKEFADEAAAREYALEAARDLVCVSIREYGAVNLDHSIEVADPGGAVLFSVTFRDAFTITGSAWSGPGT